MGLFGAIVRTAVNVACLPVDVVKDVATLGGQLTDDESAVVRRARRLKTESDSEYNDLVDRIVNPEDHR